jgi:hypothetical protein
MTGRAGTASTGLTPTTSWIKIQEEEEEEERTSSPSRLLFG